MGFQDDYVMRPISDLVRASARLVLKKNNLAYELPEDEEKDTELDRRYRRIKTLVDEGDVNGAENMLFEEVDSDDLRYLEVALTFYMYLNELNDEELINCNYSREEIVEGINSICAEFGITGFEHFVDTTMV